MSEPSCSLLTEVWCVHSTTDSSGQEVGPNYIRIKHPDGPALIGFATRALAEKFIEAWELPEGMRAVPSTELGSSGFPYSAESELVMVIATLDELKAYALDPRAFTEAAKLRRFPIRHRTG